MFVVVLSLVIMRLTSGLLFLHWLALGLISLARSIVSLMLIRWKLMLLPKWIGVLAAFQLSHIAGAATRVWWSGSTEEQP
jgi:hypothetical protein